MQDQTELIAELVSFHQKLIILAMRLDDNHRNYRGVSTEEIFELEKKLNYRFLDLPKDLQKRITEVRKEKYGIV
jgi:hypothetical protein